MCVIWIGVENWWCGEGWDSYVEERKGWIPGCLFLMRTISQQRVSFSPVQSSRSSSFLDTVTVFMGVIYSFLNMSKAVLIFRSVNTYVDTRVQGFLYLHWQHPQRSWPWYPSMLEKQHNRDGEQTTYVTSVTGTSMRHVKLERTPSQSTKIKENVDWGRVRVKVYRYWNIWVYATRCNLILSTTAMTMDLGKGSFLRL